jgi:NADH-quinone oxidoreductase subunit F
MVIDPNNIFYCHIEPEDVGEIISQSVGGNEVIERLLYTDPATGKKVQTEA